MENHKHREKETMQLQNSQRTTGISKSMHAYLQSPVQLFATPCTAARQASLSITNSQSLPKPMSIESVMPSSHLILCLPSPALNLSQLQGLFK